MSVNNRHVIIYLRYMHECTTKNRIPFLKLLLQKKNFLFILFLFFYHAILCQYNWKHLDDTLDAMHKVLGKNMVMLIYKNDSIVYKKEFGKFSTKTIKPIASCSKWLTAACVMEFVDAGLLSLDDKVAQYIPSFNKESKRDITIRQCLSHMTGIKDIGMVKGLIKRDQMLSLEEEVNSFAAEEMRESPGTGFWYGNIGVNIAARVLEVITNKSFEELIETCLFVPLDMIHTTFYPTGKAPVNPSGGAQSSPEDYMKFLSMLLNKGVYKGKRILSENAIEEMKKVQDNFENIRYAPKPAKGYKYASGSWVDEENTGVAISLASPGFFGTWPMINYCRDYAFIIFVKSLLTSKRADAEKRVKKMIDEVIKVESK